MNPRRLIAAAAAVLTVLVLQATVVTPLTASLAVSLPAILVAAIGVELGVSAGLSVGFCAGLLADLGSQHPAGVLALAWLLLGAVTGLLGQPRRRAYRSVAVVTVTTGACGLLVSLALALFDAPSMPFGSIVVAALPSTAVDAALALLLVPAVRAMRRALRVRRSSRAPRPSRGVVSAGPSPSRVAVDG
jgi:rod shape-determining protein MreD